MGFPGICACCGRIADGYSAVTAMGSRHAVHLTLKNIPSCASCLMHRGEYHKVEKKFFVSAMHLFGGLPLVWSAALASRYPTDTVGHTLWYLAAELIPLILALALFRRINTTRWKLPRLSPACAGQLDPVEIDKEESGLYLIEMENAAFAAAMASLNSLEIEWLTVPLSRTAKVHKETDRLWPFLAGPFVWLLASVAGYLVGAYVIFSTPLLIAALVIACLFYLVREA
jgi:hypothetical protein